MMEQQYIAKLEAFARDHYLTSGSLGSLIREYWCVCCDSETTTNPTTIEHRDGCVVPHVIANGEHDSIPVNVASDEVLGPWALMTGEKVWVQSPRDPGDVWNPLDVTLTGMHRVVLERINDD